MGRAWTSTPQAVQQGQLTTGCCDVKLKARRPSQPTEVLSCDRTHQIACCAAASKHQHQARERACACETLLKAYYMHIVSCRESVMEYLK